MFVAHPTVRLKGTEHVWQPIICTDKNCQNRDRKNHMHCPLCQSATCSTDLAYMKMHFRVKHVDEGLDCKTGFYSLRCHRHCNIINSRKEKLLKTPHLHCFKCRNAFKRKDDLIVHYQSHRVHKNNGKVTPATHVVLQKDINRGMLMERKRRNFQTLARIHPCPAKVPESNQPQNGDTDVQILPESHTASPALNQPTATSVETEVTSQSPAAVNNSTEYSLTEDQISEDVEIHIVDIRSPDVVRHSEAVATIINSDSPLDLEKNNFVFLKKDRSTSPPHDNDDTSQQAPSMPSQNDAPVPRKEDLCKTQSFSSQNSVRDQSFTLRGRSLLTQLGKSVPPLDKEQTSANGKLSSDKNPRVDERFTAQNGHIPSSQSDHSETSQSDDCPSSNSDQSLSPRTEQRSLSERELSLPSRKDQDIHQKETENLPSQRDESSSSPKSDDCSSCTDSSDQISCKDGALSSDKNENHSHEDCINQRRILLEEKKELEKGLGTAKKEKNRLVDTIRGMADAISQLREENKEMNQKLSKLAEENTVLRRQLNAITSAIFSFQSVKSLHKKNSPISKNKSKSPVVNRTILLTRRPVNSVAKETSSRAPLPVMSGQVVRMKSILSKVTDHEDGIHQSPTGPELQTSLGQKVDKGVNRTEGIFSEKEDGAASRLQNVPSPDRNLTKDKRSETEKLNPSRNQLSVSPSSRQADHRNKSLHVILQEAFNNCQVPLKINEKVDGTGGRSQAKEDISKPRSNQSNPTVSTDKPSDTLQECNPSKSKSGISSRSIKLDSRNKPLHVILQEAFNNSQERLRSHGKDDTSDPNRPQNVPNMDKNRSENNQSENTMKSNPSKSKSGVSSSGVQLGISNKSLHDVLKETLNGTQVFLKIVNGTEEKSQGKEATSQLSRFQNVPVLSKNLSKDNQSERATKSNPSNSESGISSSGVHLASGNRSVHDIAEETLNGSQEHEESQMNGHIGADLVEPTRTSGQSVESLLSEVLETELETQNVTSSSFEAEKEVLSRSECSSPLSGTTITASSTDENVEFPSFVAKNHILSQNGSNLSTLRQSEYVFDQGQDIGSSEFLDSTESLLDMLEASLNGDPSLGSIGLLTPPPSAEMSDSEPDRVDSSLLSSILTSSSQSENNDQGIEDISQELARFGDNTLTTVDPSLISPSFEISPHKEFETSFFGSSENFLKQVSLFDVLRLDENFDFSQVSDEFSVLDGCFDSDAGEKNFSGYSVCPLSALLDDDNFLLNATRESEVTRGRKRYLSTDETGRPKKKKK